MDAGRFAEAERALVELVALGGMETSVNQLRRRMEEAKVYGGLKPGQVIRDHFINQGFWTPESVIVKAGSFMMGSSAFESGHRDNESPEHRVTFQRGFAIGQTEVTVGQFRVFVERTHHRTDAEKLGYSHVYDHYSGRLARRDKVTWRMDYEGREADDDLPVVHVTWNDAIAYTRWLAKGTGKPYRLPTEAEFEYVQRAGRTSLYWWGDGAPPRVVENLTGEGDTSRGRRKWEVFFEGYDDGHWGPAPVASFPANPFGLYDVGGNVGEWVADCWHDSYIRAPDDGSAWINPGCNQRVVRGGYWASSPEQARSAWRMMASPTARDARIGFRIARDL
jgi:formylglycine-generating enzyme required for sulfatase activity